MYVVRSGGTCIYLYFDEELPLTRVLNNEVWKIIVNWLQTTNGGGIDIIFSDATNTFLCASKNIDQT